MGADKISGKLTTASDEGRLQIGLLTLPTIWILAYAANTSPFAKARQCVRRLANGHDATCAYYDCRIL